MFNCENMKKTQSKEIKMIECIIENKIYYIRNQKVMIDSDLSFLYQVETKVLNQAVKRNIDRFPEDFMFQLDNKEEDSLRSQFVIANYGERKYKPFVFTEQGVAMLSSILKSPRAIQVNIQIMRTFTKMRRILAAHTEIKDKVLEMESKYDENFKIIFDAIELLIQEEEKPKKQIGFDPIPG